MHNANPWIDRWLGAWELMSTKVLHIGRGRNYDMVFFDENCEYTMTAGKWRAKPHHGQITTPDGKTVPVGLMSFSSGSEKSGPFFVMAGPDIWVKAKAATSTNDKRLTAVFLHEYSHVRQVGGFDVIGSIEKDWKFKDSFDDDVVQSHFGSNEEYVKAFNTERDLLYRAAAANSIDEVRSLASEALSMMKSRHARWFVGDEAVFATLDSVWLSLEGSGQWIGYAYLANPHGGAMSAQEAIDKMRGRKKWWSQDEGLGLFLVVDRLMPQWPSLVFHRPSMGALELLERATTVNSRASR